MANYVSIDHSASFKGEAPWVQATPLADWHLPAPKEHTTTVILIHGFANSGAAWVPIAQYLPGSLPHLRFVLPNAPVIPVTLPGGKREDLPAWLNPNLDKGTALPGDAPSEIVDRAGWDASYKFLEGIIEEEAKLVGERKIFVGGFSQGTLYAAALGLASAHVEGIIGLSSRIVERDALAKIPAKSVVQKAVFWGHGDSDNLAPHEFGEKSVEFLASTFGLQRIPQGAKPSAGTVQFNLYAGLAHFTSTKEVEDIRDWLAALLPAA